MKLGNHLDFSQFEARNAVFQNLSGAPSSPKPGQVYYLTGSNVPFYWNGTSGRPLDAAALADGSIGFAALATIRHDQWAAPNTAVSWGNQEITALKDPTTAQSAATRNYVDSAVQSAVAGIDSKASVRAIATANITLSGTQTIDGVSLVAGDRVLAAAQTTAAQNGVYVVASGTWARALDADQSGEITPGAFWFVEEGSTYGKTQWRCNNTGTITIGTTAITIVQFGAATSYSNGNGLSLTGNVFAVLLPANSGLTVSGTGVAIDPSVVARKFSATITGDGSTTSFPITHGLATQDVVVSVRDSSNNLILADVVMTSTTQITVVFGTAPASASTYRATIIG